MRPTLARVTALALGIAATLGAAACAPSVAVRTLEAPGAAPQAMRTFAVATPRRAAGPANPAAASEDPLADNGITSRAVREALREDFESRGYLPEVAAPGRRPDFVVACYTAAHARLVPGAVDYVPTLTRRGWIVDHPVRERTPEERGTVVVDVLDARSGRLLWRGEGVATVSEDPTTYARDLQREVAAVVRKFPHEA